MLGLGSRWRRSGARRGGIVLAAASLSCGVMCVLISCRTERCEESVGESSHPNPNLDLLYSRRACSNMRLVIRHALPPRCFGLNSTTSIIGGSTALTSPRRWKYRLPALPGLYCRSGRTTPGAARAPPRSPRSDDGTSSFVRAPRPGEWASKRSGSSGPQSGGAAVGLLPRRASRGKAGAPIMVERAFRSCGHQGAPCWQRYSCNWMQLMQLG